MSTVDLTTVVSERAEMLALRYPGGELSYGALDRRADRVSGGLRAGTRVGLLAPVGPEFVAGLLGILRAGAACVPLPVSDPVSRLGAIVRSSGCAAVVTTAQLRFRTVALGAPAVVADDGDAPERSGTGVAVAPESVCCLWYPGGQAELAIEITAGEFDKAMLAFVESVPGRPRTILSAPVPPYAELLGTLFAGGVLTVTDQPARGLAVPRPAPAAQPYVAPDTDLQQRLVALWSEVLEVPRVGVHDDFFDLGGQSILAIRLLVRLRERLGYEVPVRAIFDLPTVAGMSRYLTELGVR